MALALLVILVLLTTLGFGLLLILRGMFGVRVGDHPFCGFCGFDLFGQPNRTVICGECGRSPANAGRIVIGQRQRRHGSLAVGLFLLASFSVGAGVIGSREFRRVNWWTHAPLWYLLREASSADGKRRAPALLELSARFSHGRLADPQLNQVLDAGLAYQGDLTRPWDHAWGDLIEDAQRAGKVSTDRWARYAKQAIAEPVKYSVQSVVTLGQNFSWQVDTPAPRLAMYSRFRIYVSSSYSWSGVALTPGGFGLPGGGSGLVWFSNRPTPCVPDRWNHSEPLPAGFEPGTFGVELHTNRSLSDLEQNMKQLSQDHFTAGFQVIAAAATRPI